MQLPARLTIHDFAYHLDGGTTVLKTADEMGRQHGVTLVQHAFLQVGASLEPTPGRLYFDGELVPLRSDLEAGVLSLLRNAEVKPPKPTAQDRPPMPISPNAHIFGDDIRQVMSRNREENILALSTAVVQFVESDAYLRFAERVEQAADPTRYTVWVAWEPANRNHVIVRLGQMLGIGLPRARHLLDDGAPLVKQSTALEVGDLAKTYSAAGVSLRVEPPFRWPLS